MNKEVFAAHVIPTINAYITGSNLPGPGPDILFTKAVVGNILRDLADAYEMPTVDLVMNAAGNTFLFDWTTKE